MTLCRARGCQEEADCLQCQKCTGPNGHCFCDRPNPKVRARVRIECGLDVRYTNSPEVVLLIDKWAREACPKSNNPQATVRVTLLREIAGARQK